MVNSESRRIEFFVVGFLVDDESTGDVPSTDEESVLVRLRNLSGIHFSAIPENEGDGEKRTSADESKGRERGDGKVTQLRMPTSTVEEGSLPSSDGSLPYSE